MEAEPKTPGQDGPAAPTPFRFLAAGTLTGGKSFWLTADGSGAKPSARICLLKPRNGGDCHECCIQPAENRPH